MKILGNLKKKNLSQICKRENTNNLIAQVRRNTEKVNKMKVGLRGFGWILKAENRRR